MSNLLLTVLAGIGTLVVFLVLLKLALALVRRLRRRRIKRGTVLEIDFSRGISEGEPEGGWLRGRSRAMRLMDLVLSLERAAEDPRIEAVIADLSHCRMGMGTAEEIRDAILLIRKSGKRTIAFSESFSGGGEGMVQYFLASAFEQIWLQPSGSLGIAGFRAETMFLRQALERVGVEPEIGQRHEYKSAAEMFLRDGMSPEAKSGTEAILAGLVDVFVGGVAAERGIEESKLRGLLSEGPFLAGEARAHGLVDSLGYRDEAYDSACESAKQAPLLYIDRYLAKAGTGYRKRGAVVAVIHGVGAIGHGDGAIPGRRPVMRADRMSKAFRAAVRDRSVKGILFRVDSPGGSYVASDTIAREVKRAREAGKPVVVSMGNVAASGGYFVSMYADRILARDSTLTGSIGVFGGKFAARRLWEKLGVNWDGVSTHENSDYWSSVHPYSEMGLAKRERELDLIYEDFAGKAATARGLTLEEMDRLARGRVWPGIRAKTVKLTDGRGGYREAIAALRELAQVPASRRVRLKVFPKKRSLLDRWITRPPESSRESEVFHDTGLDGALSELVIDEAYQTAYRVGAAIFSTRGDEKNVLDSRLSRFLS